MLKSLKIELNFGTKISYGNKKFSCGMLVNQLHKERKDHPYIVLGLNRTPGTHDFLAGLALE